MDNADFDTNKAESSNANKNLTDGSGTSGDANSINRKYLHFNFLVYVETSQKRSHQENHLNRLQNLRKELNHLKDSEWQFEPIDKLIGQL